MSRAELAPAILEGYNHRNAEISLRDLRHLRGKSLRVVEEELGISRATLSRVERGMEAPTLGLLGLLSNYYDVSFESWKARNIWFTTDAYSPQEGDDAADTEERVDTPGLLAG